MTRLVLITGSRDWTDRRRIKNVLTKELNENGRFVLISGGCPTGADKICEEVALSLGLLVERHPADREKYGKRAGYIRNAEMVNLNPDVCYAFSIDDSKGTQHTINLAHKKDIRVVRHDMTTLERIFAEYSPGSQGSDWTWEDEADDLLGRDLKYMAELKNDIWSNGMHTPVLLGDDGRVWDGHHRIITASHLRLKAIPTIKSSDAGHINI